MKFVQLLVLCLQLSYLSSASASACVHDNTLASRARARAHDSFTEPERLALDQLRPLVSDALTADFMKSDQYLVNWLRARELNAQAASSMLLKAVEWRRANHFDSDPKEDFSGWDKKFPHNLDGVDKYGHPILVAAIGKWNPRQLILGGQGPRYTRFMIRTLFELPAAKARESACGGSDGQHVSVFDLHGFNLRQHLCLSCIPSYRAMVTAMQDLYPFQSNRTLIINAPAAFETLMQSLQPVLQTPRRNSLQVFGFDKKEWTDALLETIDPSQLPAQYGGTGQRKFN